MQQVAIKQILFSRCTIGYLLVVYVYMKLSETKTFTDKVPVEADMNTKLDWVLAKLAKLDRIEDKLDRLEDKIDNYEFRLQEINNRLTYQDDKIKDIDEKLAAKASINDFDGLDERLKHLECLAEKTHKDSLMRESYSKLLNLLIHGLSETEGTVWENKGTNPTYLQRFHDKKDYNWTP